MNVNRNCFFLLGLYNIYMFVSNLHYLVVDHGSIPYSEVQRKIIQFI